MVFNFERHNTFSKESYWALNIMNKDVVCIMWLMYKRKGYPSEGLRQAALLVNREIRTMMKVECSALV